MSPVAWTVRPASRLVVALYGLWNHSGVDFSVVDRQGVRMSRAAVQQYLVAKAGSR